MIRVSVEDQVQSVTTSMSGLADGMHKAMHIKEVTKFLSVRVADIFKMKMKITSNNNTALSIATVLEKDWKFLEKAQIRHFVCLPTGRPVHTVEGDELLALHESAELV